MGGAGGVSEEAPVRVLVSRPGHRLMRHPPPGEGNILVCLIRRPGDDTKTHNGLSDDTPLDPPTPGAAAAHAAVSPWGWGSPNVDENSWLSAFFVSP
jgi:hypothetical protein